MTKPRLRRVKIAIVVNLVVIVLLFVLAEGGLVLLLDHPPRSRPWPHACAPTTWHRIDGSSSTIPHAHGTTSR